MILLKVLITVVLLIFTAISVLLFASGKTLRVLKPSLSLLCYIAAVIMLLPLLFTAIIGIKAWLPHIKNQNENSMSNQRNKTTINSTDS